jgi:hypothetical protein
MLCSKLMDKRRVIQSFDPKGESGSSPLDQARKFGPMGSGGNLPQQVDSPKLYAERGSSAKRGKPCETTIFGVFSPQSPNCRGCNAKETKKSPVLTVLSHGPGNPRNKKHLFTASCRHSEICRCFKATGVRIASSASPIALVKPCLEILTSCDPVPQRTYRYPRHQTSVDGIDLGNSSAPWDTKPG